MREHSEESVKFIPRYKVKIFVYKKLSIYLLISFSSPVRYTGCIENGA
jgi:hypothetical protein